MTHRIERPSPVLDKLRALATPRLRGYLHGLTPVALGALVTFGYLTDAKAAVIAGAVLAAVDLVLALVNSTNSWRTALYGLAAALQPVGVAFGLGTNAEWVAALAVFAALLGSGVAAAKTPTLSLRY
ncbi:Uncharacterised protein [Mycobacteroides abscessus subsp. abscessus]|nr:Uncharacterised protein [Mycobacteroides abscessus subsp. abscessus]